MTGYEEQLYARAEMLEETGELAAAVAEILAGASGAGVDPAPSPACGTPSGRSTRQAAHPATRRAAAPTGTRAAGTASDAEFLEAISDAEDDGPRTAARGGSDLQEQVTAALDAAERRPRAGPPGPDAGPGWTSPPRTPCPPRTRATAATAAKAAAIAAAEAAVTGAEGRIRDAERRIGLCEDTAGILDPLAQRLQAASRRCAAYPPTSARSTSSCTTSSAAAGNCRATARWIEGAPA